jgi:MFS family permease
MKQLDRRWKVLLVTGVAVFMAFLDVTIVNVAFPSIAADFPGTSLADLSWVLNAYNIVFAALLVPAGRLADRIGQRRTFFGGLWVFLAGSVLCGVAPDAALLIAARVVQAVGAAALIPASLALVLPEFPPERRAVATSVWAAAGAVAAATGPSLGGVLVDAGGRRWAFFVNLVIALGVLPARRLLVDRADPESSPPDMFGGALLLANVLHTMAHLPALVVWGTHDRVIPVGHADAVRDLLPRAEVALLEEIGHTPHVSQPAYVGERIVAWIGGGERDRGAGDTARAGLGRGLPS